MGFSRSGRGFVKPPAGAQLDRSHPLARGLEIDVEFNEVISGGIVPSGGNLFRRSGGGSQELVYGKTAKFEETAQVSGGSLVWNWPGVNFHTTNGSKVRLLNADYPDARFVGAITVLWKGIVLASNVQFCGKQQGNTTAPSPFSLEGNGSTFNLARVNAGGRRAASSVGTTRIGANTLYAASQIADISAPVNLYINFSKEVVTPAGSGSGPATGNGKDFLIGDRDDDGLRMDGICDFVRIYSRVLTDDEIRWVNEEPYAHLRPVSYRQYFTATATASQPVPFIIT